MANLNRVFSNMGPGLSKDVHEQSGASQIMFGKSDHFNMRHDAQNARDKADNITTGGLTRTRQNIGAYYKGEDYQNATGGQRAGVVAARAGLTVGAYGALALGTRYASGGTAGYNNRGERDIAGIPFV